MLVIWFFFVFTYEIKVNTKKNLNNKILEKNETQRYLLKIYNHILSFTMF